MKTVVIGMGSPFLSDDRLGLIIVQKLKTHFEGQKLKNVDFVELYAGGIRLIDALKGYDRAIIVDAMVTRQCEPGTIKIFTPEQIKSTKNTICVHDMDFRTAIELAKLVEIPIPKDIKIWGVEAKNIENFGEALTESVAQAVPRVVGEVINELGEVWI